MATAAADQYTHTHGRFRAVGQLGGKRGLNRRPISIAAVSSSERDLAIPPSDGSASRRIPPRRASN